jgi:hypothetical protein
MNGITKTGLILTIIAAACTNDGSKHKSNNLQDSAMLKNELKSETTVKKIFFNLPSPVELTQTLLKTKEPFKIDLLNPISNLEKYNTSSSLALNFGVYGADLCYCRVYDQLQESISYLSVIRKITDKLQIPEEEGSQTINRIEESIDNRDSIFHIISDTYASADSYLKENERDLTASLILVGGWVEGMHFAINIAAKNKSDQEIINRIAEQKYTLDNLLSLIDQYKDHPGVSDLVPYFIKLKEVYTGVNINHDKPVIVTDKDEQVTKIDNPGVVIISAEQLNKISQLVDQVRNKIIS